MQVSNRREQGERSRRYAVYGIPRFVVSALKADCWQQPFRGVGRLRLSSIRHAQPHVDKCNDSRLFLFSFKKRQRPLQNKSEFRRIYLDGQLTEGESQ